MRLSFNVLLGVAVGSAVTVSNSIVDLAVATPDHSTLVTALKAADLVGTLSSKGPFTVFAPTNEAFAALPAGVLANLLKPENKAQLVDILTYHVASGDVHAKDLHDMEMIKTVEGKSVTARISGSSVYINSAKVVTADVDASNGVVHIIDSVLMPGDAPKPAGKTIVDLAVATPDLSTLVAALKAADLVDTLSGKGPFTVFAPTNEAFAALPAGVLANLLKPENKAQLVDILTYHVASGDVQSKDLTDMEMIKTVEGKDVQARVSNKDILINSAKVTAADNEASNGVVHIIDAVLMPGDAPTPTPSQTNHCWFRGVTCTEFHDNLCRCGEVDAASRMPASLFDPENAAALKRYKEITVMFYDYSSLVPELGQLELGRCKDIGYDSDAGGSQGTAWTPGKKLMGPICAEQCHCSYGSYGNTSYPHCKDQPDDPKAGKWCSLCGPKYNQPITVELYNGDCRKQDNQLCVNTEPYACSNGQCVHSKDGIYTKSGCAERCH